MQQHASTIVSNIDNARNQLKAAESLRPEMEEMQKSLAGALVQVQKQQETISSSENFVREVFSTHRTDYFTYGTNPSARIKIQEPPPGQQQAVIIFLLSATPISETLQLQFKLFAQPPNSYFSSHNVVMFYWDDSVDTFKGGQLSASYFPDKSDKVHINALTEKEGRIYADEEALPFLNRPDPDFRPVPGGKVFSFPIGPLPAGIFPPAAK
jgi:hypothetical protein